MIEEQEGTVAVWLGCFDDPAGFDDYMEVPYDEDDEDALAPFMIDQGIGWYDEDFQEAACEDLKPVRDLLEGFSYLESYRDSVCDAARAMGLKEINTAIFLFDNTNPNPKPGSIRGLRFLGNFPYSKT